MKRSRLSSQVANVLPIDQLAERIMIESLTHCVYNVYNTLLDYWLAYGENVCYVRVILHHLSGCILDVFFSYVFTHANISDVMVTGNTN